MTEQNITIVGAGYVGYSLAVMLSQSNKVLLLDKDEQKVDLINKNNQPIEDELIVKYRNEKNLDLIATKDNKKAYKNAKYIIIAVPTSYDEANSKFDTTIIDGVLDSAFKENPDALIIIKSTLNVGYCEDRSKFYNTNKIAYAPEFLREGSALYDNLYPSRLIFGVKNQNIFKDYIETIKSVTLSDTFPILITGYHEAESIKLFSNAYLANRVAFFNELDSFCILKNINTKDVINGVCFDKRIGDFYNNPSFGFGGYCLPKDTKQLVADFGDIPQEVFSATIKSNAKRAEFISQQIISKGYKKCGIYRLVMKKNSDNYRESSAIRLIKHLRDGGVRVSIFEPLIKSKEIYGCPVENNLSNFKSNNPIIIANRLSNEINDVVPKIYTRDVFNMD